MAEPVPKSFGRNSLHESTSPTGAYTRAEHHLNNERAVLSSTWFGEQDEEEACLPSSSADHSGSCASPRSTYRVSSSVLAIAGFSRWEGVVSAHSDDELDEERCAQVLRPWRSDAWSIFLTVSAGNIGLVACCLLVAMVFPEVMALSVVAYIRGLCRGLDINHAAAVGGILRQLMLHALGQPASIGIWFSLGHSAVVLIVAGEHFVTRGLEEAEHRKIIATSHAASTCATTAALYSFGLLNIQMAASMLMGSFGHRSNSDQGPCGRVCNGQDWLRCSLQSARLVDAQWKVFLAGMLFGMSSATAAAVAPSKAEMHAVGADEKMEAPPPFGLLAPIAFAAGLAMADASLSLLMLEAYGWATSDPLHKIGYNALVTFVPALAAMIAGVRDTASLIVLTLPKDMDDEESSSTSLLRQLHPGELPGVVAGLSLMVITVCTLLASLLTFRCWPHLRRAREARRAGFQPSVDLCMEESERVQQVSVKEGMQADESVQGLSPYDWS